jgi:TDG/mug DNA glycosylase family protein
VLKDVECDHPQILFVGINPGERSGRLGHHFAGAGNPFWRLLYASRLTPVELPPQQDQRLAEFGYALTNLAARSTRTAAELRRDELARGVKILEAKVRAWQPRLVALVGLTLYAQVCAGKTKGAGRKPELLEGVPIFVVPNPSGLNASFPGFEDKLVWFKALRRYLQRLQRSA